MKKKQLAELRLKSAKEIFGLIEKAKEELARLGLDIKAGKTKNPHQLGLKSRSLAQLKTIFKEKEINEKT